MQQATRVAQAATEDDWCSLCGALMGCRRRGRVCHVTCRYRKMAFQDACKLWQRQYDEGGKMTQPSGKGFAGGRLRELLIIGGLVLPVWQLVEKVLQNQDKPSDQKMNVLRLQTTGTACNRTRSGVHAVA